MPSPVKSGPPSGRPIEHLPPAPTAAKAALPEEDEVPPTVATPTTQTPPNAIPVRSGKTMAMAPASGCTMMRAPYQPIVAMARIIHVYFVMAKEEPERVINLITPDI